ncbi:RNA-directed DNA polymerase [Abeliophyllum distichum]|uniref:RNA-directed DNA polymerase n=1 Tax=Abeliophyllum distichum TaxID=126358 RepID=A0ABD1RTR0_9LAMI
MLRKYRMKLNLLKCAFRVASGKFLGYMVNQRGDRGQSRKNSGAHQDEIPLIPQRSSELDGKVSSPEPVYIQGHRPMSAFLSNHQGRKKVRMDGRMRKPSRTSKSFSERLCYYPSQRFEKRCLSTWPYLKGQQILQKPDTSGRLMKWSVELSQFDISYKSRPSIKGQALADLVVKFAHIPEGEVGARAEILLISPDGHNLNCAFHLEFKASNNAAEYDALLVGLRLAQEMKARKLQIHSDSQLVVSQINGTFATREQSMVAYLKKAKDLLSHFEVYELLQIPRVENGYADALSKLVSSKDSNLMKAIPVEKLSRPTIDESLPTTALTISESPEMDEGKSSHT